MSARQMYSSSIKSPFPPSPPPALAAIPPGLCGGSGADAGLGWEPADFGLPVPMCCLSSGGVTALGALPEHLEHPAPSHTG